MPAMMTNNNLVHDFRHVFRLGIIVEDYLVQLQASDFMETRKLIIAR